MSSPDENVFEMYMQDPAGGWFKNMEIKGTRVKAGAAAPPKAPSGH